MAQHTIDLPCVADTYVDGDKPYTNYGTAQILKLYRYYYGAWDEAQYMFLKFDNSALPVRKKIISASLRLYMTNSVDVEDPGSLDIIGIRNFPWDEYTLTAQDYPTTFSAISYTRITDRDLSANAYNVFALPDVNPYNLRDGFTLSYWTTSGPEIQCHSRENTNPPTLRVVYEDVPPDKPTLISPLGVYKDAKSVIRLEWQYNSSVGGKQKKFDLQWSTNQSSWTTISLTTEDTYLDVPADTFPVGNIYWRVQTYNEYDESSGYSDVAVFYSVGAPTVPIIQSVSNDCRPTVEWSAFDQQIYQVQILQGESVIYDSREMPGISTRQYKVSIFLDDGDYTAKVRIKNEYDMWSEWGNTSFTISTTKPEKPTLSVQRSQYGLELTVSGAQEVSYIYRDSICIAEVADEKYFDNTVANGKEYRYFARALSENGFADSDIVVGTPSYRYGLLNAGDEIIELRHNINSVPGKNLNNSQSGTLNQYDGRKYSVPEMSGNVEQNITLGYFFRRYSDVEKLIEIADRKEVVLYRDKRGRKMYGKITGLSVQDIYQGHIVSITISATDYDEAVGII